MILFIIITGLLSYIKLYKTEIEIGNKISDVYRVLGKPDGNLISKNGDDTVIIYSDMIVELENDVVTGISKIENEENNKYNLIADIKDLINSLVEEYKDMKVITKFLIKKANSEQE